METLDRIIEAYDRWFPVWFTELLVAAVFTGLGALVVL
jgi:hypothetical protein